MFKLSKIMLAAAGFVLAPLAIANPHIIAKPNCLPTPQGATVIAKQNDISILSIPEQSWEQVIQAQPRKSCGKMIDVSHLWLNHHGSSKKLLTALQVKKMTAHAQHKIAFQEDINHLVQQVDTNRIMQFLNQLTSFPDRYAGNNFTGSANGVAAEHWLFSEIDQQIKKSGRKDCQLFTIETRGEENYAQPSIVLRIGNSEKPGVVIGAHMDTISSVAELKPGADDDGSGSSSIFEAMRVILNSGHQFEHPIYFIWYAAEELGLVGSQVVVQDFKAKQIPIKSVAQFDMTGYVVKNDFSMWLLEDYTDPNLTSDLAALIKTYTHRPVKYTACGYGCSDHASWTLGGYSAAATAESAFEDSNPYIHSSDDTIDRLSPVHMADFARLAVAFAAEEAVIKK